MYRGMVKNPSSNPHLASQSQSQPVTHLQPNLPHRFFVRVKWRQGQEKYVSWFGSARIKEVNEKIKRPSRPRGIGTDGGGGNL